MYQKVRRSRETLPNTADKATCGPRASCASKHASDRTYACLVTLKRDCDIRHVSLMITGPNAAYTAKQQPSSQHEHWISQYAKFAKACKKNERVSGTVHYSLLWRSVRCLGSLVVRARKIQALLASRLEHAQGARTLQELQASTSLTLSALVTSVVSLQTYH
jgi:hypothetical protein